jgi:hypothetical protein
MDTTCIVCYADDAPVFVCRYECRVRVHAACLDAWYRRQYVCPICRCSMFPRWLAECAPALLIACVVAWCVLFLPVYMYWAFWAPVLVEGWSAWFFLYASAFVADCIYDLRIAMGEIRCAPKLFRRPVARVAINAFVALGWGNIVNVVIYCRLALAKM